MLGSLENKPSGVAPPRARSDESPSAGLLAPSGASLAPATGAATASTGTALGAGPAAALVTAGTTLRVLESYHLLHPLPLVLEWRLKR